MYTAKQRGRNRFELYRAEMSQENSRRMLLEQELRRALANDEFELFYQPKVNLASGSMSGMEALLRWRHPERGLVSPAEFIPTLEETGLIVPVGEWVLREACRANRRWQDQGLPALTVSVNVSPEQLRREDFTDVVADVLTDTGLQSGYLELEMTESCLLEETEASAAMLRALKSLGVRIAIDDFGTGYASMTYLKRYPVDVLKIDQSFMQRLSSKSEDTAIVTAIMALVHSLRLEVVAEGVETAQQLTFLYALGCNVIQGFLFSRPLPEDEFVRQLLSARDFREQIAHLEFLGAQSA
jgi:EAL domain-containing protein (putative c-di-GMP-specific phosphodiesterase class I)